MHGCEVREVRVGAVDGGWQFEAEVHSGELSPNSLRVELYAEPAGGGGGPLRHPMDRGEAAMRACHHMLFPDNIRAGLPESTNRSKFFRAALVQYSL